MSESKFSCYLIGADTLLTQCGEILLERGHVIGGVVTDAARVSQWARGHHIEVIPASGDYAATLADRTFDYLFAITHLALIPDAAVSTPTRLAINFHDGPLPSYAGLNTPMWAIMNGEQEHGISWHLMAAGIDEGDLLVQQRFPLSEDETALSLNTKCFAAALETFPTLLEQLETDQTSPTPQDLEHRTYYGRKDVVDSLGVLNWERPAAELARIVRGLHVGAYENPLASAKIAMGDRFYLVDAAEAAGAEAAAAEASDGKEASGAAGTIVALNESTMDVACAEGVLRIHSLRSLAGENVALTEVTAELGLREGLRFATPMLNQPADAIAAQENFWSKRLRRVVAPDLPYREATPGLGIRQRTAVSVPAAFTEQYGVDAIAAAFQLFMARVCAGTEVHCALPLNSADTLNGADELLLSGVGFSRFTLDAQASAVSELKRSADVIGRTRSKAPWLKDLVARTPQLRSNPMLTGSTPLAVAIQQAGDRDADAELCLQLGSEGEAELQYLSSAYTEAGINSLIQHFEAMLAWFTSAGDAEAREISLLTPAARDCLLTEWNRTDLDYDSEQTIHGGIAEQIRNNPTATALVANGQQITYQELGARVDALAAELLRRGIGPDTLVGVHVPRSIELVVAALGVMRAGGAYVPLDPAFPADRIAFMIEDSKMSTIISSHEIRSTLPDSGAEVLAIESVGADAPVTEVPAITSSADDLAYVIYTSGSTGLPKGVMLEHRNAVNFFAAMDERVPGSDAPGVWLAVTSLSFDISILELFWTLSRGFKVVVYDEQGSRRQPASTAPLSKKLDMGLFMWGNDDAPGAAKYRLLMEGSKYFDENGFSAVWTPERHFHAFGGPYPNPAVTGAAVAAVTKNVKIRAGSCVVPLHHPVRIAEEWSVVDNLSDGRVELASASGWNPNDFVLKPENHANNKQVMFDQLDQVRALWRGEKLSFPGPLGKDVEVQSLPRPVQKDLPCWITTAGNPDTWREAGKLGLNVLTHLLGQTVEEVGEKIRIYREARREAGYDPDAGQVALMLHTFVGDDNDEVRELVREPMKSYLGSSMKLAMDFAWSFPAFKRPGGEDSKPDDIDLSSLSEDEIDTILDFAFERYFETSGLFGDHETCVAMLRACDEIGVDEIACLLDFGVETERVMGSLPALNEVRKEIQGNVAEAEAVTSEAPVDLSFAGLVRDHRVTHMQCTPSTVRMLMTDADARSGIAAIEHLLLGGEALPEPLADEVLALSPGTLTNMYGPTETTIWSTTSTVAGGPVNIGTPIGNTRVYVLDSFRSPVPVGMPGELFIGGDGVARGYFNRSALTAERFLPDPFAGEGARMYATGDLVRWHEDGYLQYLGRTDFQVKVRGYRIELGEIEKQLEQLPAIQEAAVIVRSEDDTDQRLVAFVVPAPGESIDPQNIRSALREPLPEYMIPNEVIGIEAMPQTANAKLDRKALQAIKPKPAVTSIATVAADSDLEQHIADLWCQTLKLERVGVEDNFFDLGGHSLLVVQLHKKIRESVEQPVSLTDLYQFPTVRSLAEHMEGGNTNTSSTKGAQRGERRRAMRRRGAR